MSSKIMIIDDNIDYAEALGFSLGADGYIVRTLPDPTEALKEVYDFEPNLIICDYHMPKMSGGEFIAHIRKDARFYPLIFISGDDSREILLKLFRLGAADIILKTAPIEEISASVVRTLEMEKLRVQMYLSNDDATKKKLGRLLGLHQTINSKKTA